MPKSSIQDHTVITDVNSLGLYLDRVKKPDPCIIQIKNNKEIIIQFNTKYQVNRYKSLVML